MKSHRPKKSEQVLTNKKIYNKDDDILIKNLTKKFGNFTAVDNLSVSIK